MVGVTGYGREHMAKAQCIYDCVPSSILARVGVASAWVTPPSRQTLRPVWKRQVRLDGCHSTEPLALKRGALSSGAERAGRLAGEGVGARPRDGPGEAAGVLRAAHGAGAAEDGVLRRSTHVEILSLCSRSYSGLGATHGEPVQGLLQEQPERPFPVCLDEVTRDNIYYHELLRQDSYHVNVHTEK